MKQVKTIKSIIKHTLSAVTGIFILTVNAYAFTPTTEMTDISPNHWAFRAIQGLVEKYQVMEGYPDKTFRGARNMTRYEMAAVLYKMLAKVEEMIAQAGLHPTANVQLPTSEELQTLIALQKEFKEELLNIGGKLAKIEDSMNLLDKVKVGGSLEVKYRDRLSVTDDKVGGGPLSTGNPDKEGKTSPARNFISAIDAYPIRARAHLNVDALFNQELEFTSSFAIDEMAFSMTLPPNVPERRAYIAGGHFGAEGMLGSPLFIEKAYVKALPSWGNENEVWGKMAFRTGLINFSDITNTGTSFKNHFSNEAWIGHGYGLLGWGGDEIKTTSDKGQPYNNTVSRFWVGDLNVSRVDPDSKRYNRVPAPAVTIETGWNAVKMMVGANFGSFYTSRTAASLGNLSGLGTLVQGSQFKDSGGGVLMNSNVIVGNLDRQQNMRSNVLDLPSEYGDGYYMFGMEFDLGKPIGNDYLPVRIGIHGMDYWNDAAFALSGTRKEVSCVLDLGTNVFGVTLQANSSFIGYDMLGFGLLANDILGSEIDFGFGAKLGMRSILAFSPKAFAASNAGMYVVLPSFNSSMPRLLLALRQSFGDTWGTEAGYQFFKDGGFTISVPFKNILNSNFDITAEYSMLAEGALWSGRSMAHDVSINSTYKF